MSDESVFEQEEIEAAAREAAQIGGWAGDEDLPEEERAVREGGGGQSEGFEDAEALLIEHASHGDDEPAHVVLHDQGRDEEATGGVDGEADHERSGTSDEA